MSKDINTEETIEFEEAGGIRKNLSGIIDAVIVMTLIITTFTLVPEKYSASLEAPGRSLLVILLSLIVYRLVGLLLFNVTAGMRICRIAILNDDLETLSLKEKIFASFLILINGVAYYETRKRRPTFPKDDY